MEDSVNAQEKIGIQIIMVSEFGGTITEHALVPTLVNIDELNELIEKYHDFLTWEIVEFDCIDQVTNSIYTGLFAENILKKSYFKFIRVNVREF